MGTPRPPGPNPPGISKERQELARGTLVMDEPEFLLANCVVLDEFLAPAELKALNQYVLEHENEFALSEVVAPGATEGAVEFEHRRSRVLMDLGPHREVILDRLRNCLPQALKRLGREPFPISRIEAQITASNDGDYFRWHTDNGQDEVACREITFVYFFHREPKPFRGGELRLYDSRRKNGGYVPTSNYRGIEPQQNQMVLFVSSLTHEITPLEMPNGRFSDSRFTVNGWLNR
jgi:Rps23 Pro-64 3,4-dihydroxylase Tpa1-like proline 4-hydroxylase